MTPHITARCNRHQSAKVAAINYIRNHGQLVRVGMVIAYAAPGTGDEWIESEFTVTAHDLERVRLHEAGQLARSGTEADRRCSYIVESTPASEPQPLVQELTR